MNERIKGILNKGVKEIIGRENLEKKLYQGKKIRIKFGIDPTARYIHIGQAVLLWKLKEFQNLGHKIILIIGDFTAQVGDPSGRTTERQSLSEKQVKANARTYQSQLKKIGRASCRERA